MGQLTYPGSYLRGDEMIGKLNVLQEQLQATMDFFLFVYRRETAKPLISLKERQREKTFCSLLKYGKDSGFSKIFLEGYYVFPRARETMGVSSFYNLEMCPESGFHPFLNINTQSSPLLDSLRATLRTQSMLQPFGLEPHQTIGYRI